ncbi:hypothetical protein Bca101_032872 [Brassica carinata]
MASESSRIGLFTNAEVTTRGRPVLRRNEVECFLLSSVDLDSEDDPPRFTSLRWKKLSIIGDLQLQQQLKVELMISSRWCCGVGYISFRSVVLKVEKTNLPHGSATIGSVASSSKVVYPDTAQMIVYDPTKKSEFSSSVKPMAASASNTFQSNVTATATHVSANTFDEIPKTTPPALLAFLANLPHVDGYDDVRKRRLVLFPISSWLRAIFRRMRTYGGGNRLLALRDARGDWNEFRAVNKLVKLRGIITAAVTSWSVPCEVLQSPLLKTSYDEDETETVSVDVGTKVVEPNEIPRVRHDYTLLSLSYLSSSARLAPRPCHVYHPIKALAGAKEIRDEGPKQLGVEPKSRSFVAETKTDRPELNAIAEIVRKLDGDCRPDRPCAWFKSPLCGLILGTNLGDLMLLAERIAMKKLYGDLAEMDNNGSTRDLIEVTHLRLHSSQKDVTSISLMSNSLHKIERCSRKRVFIGNCYAINPERLIEWFPSLRSLILKGKPHFTGFKLVPYEWVLRSLRLCRAPTLPARNGWRLKSRRAKEATGPPSQQSKARKSPALPEAEQARAAFSTRVMLIRPLPLRFFAARFDDLEPIAPVRVWLRRLRSINRHISSLIRFVGRNVEPFRERLVAIVSTGCAHGSGFFFFAGPSVAVIAILLIHITDVKTIVLLAKKLSSISRSGGDHGGRGGGRGGGGHEDHVGMERRRMRGIEKMWNGSSTSDMETMDLGLF